MSKFKVGDVIRGLKKSGHPFVNENMTRGVVVASYPNRIRVQIEENALFPNKIGKIYWCRNDDEYYELIDNIAKFKVGDIVKCVKNHDSIYCTTNLKKARVLYINTNKMTLEILEHSLETLTNAKMECTFENFEDYFELVEPMIVDIKTCGKNLLDKFKIQNNFYNSIVNGKFFTNKIEEDAYVEEMNNLYDKYIKGIWEIEEEKDMNKVLNLWYERKKNTIEEKYKLMEVQFCNDNFSVVGSFNDLIEQFNNDLEDLYKLDKATEQFVLKQNTCNNVFKYCIDVEALQERFKVEHLLDKNKEIEELDKIKEEVEAQLSLSNDLEYQQEVLINYGIIDKKTKKIV